LDGMSDAEIIAACIRRCAEKDDPDAVRKAAEAMYRKGTHWLLAWNTALACERFGAWSRNRLTRGAESA
jgi:hypothetical protein